MTTSDNIPVQPPAGKTQNATSLWAELGPAVAFILTYTLMGRFLPEGDGAFSKGTAIFWATGALMVSTAFVIITRLSQGKRIPPMLILSGSVVGFFGVLTIALQQAAFAYVKPTLVNMLFATAIFGGLALGRNVWKMMLSHVFDLPDVAWNTLAIRWGCYFIVLALLNEFLWRYFCPVPENALSLLGLVIAPTEPYTFLGIQFGARDEEHVWAWMKLGNIFITMAFMLANLPYTMKYWKNVPGKTE
jgi:intracellular septation protein